MNNNQDTYTLKSKNNFYVELSPIGAAIRTIYAPDKNGYTTNIALSPAEASQNYSGTYAGAIIGPVAGRISGAKLKIDNNTCMLSQNDGENNLHGGFGGLSSKEWDVVEYFQGDDIAYVVFETMLADGKDGFPGNRKFWVQYSVDNNMCLSLSFGATSDKKTYIDMTNHLYVNLSGDFSHSINEHKLQIVASQVCLNNPNHLPKNIVDVKGTVFDFTEAVQIGDYLKSNPALLSLGQGYNNTFLLDKTSKKTVEHAALILDEKSGRCMEILTTAAALVVYSGSYFEHNLKLLGNVYATPSCAIAMEAQSIPDCPNFMPSKANFLDAEEKYSAEICFKFTVI